MPRLPVVSSILLVFLIVGCDALEGPPGEDGNDGAANVEAETFTIDASAFQADGTAQSYTHSTSLITDRIVGEGMVLGYIRIDGEGGWTALPLTIAPESETINITYQYDEAQFELLLIASNELPDPALFDGDRIKIVAVPPEEAGSNLAAMSYDQMAARLNL